MIGRTFSHYEILEKLGEGGMGEVWKARDLRLDRFVALKVIRPGAVEDGAARERLLREARTASKLNHPHVCTIYEVGEADGRAYIAMELVEGKTLSRQLEGRKLAAGQVLQLGIQLAEALDHAHKRGVVHRDFKSANVVLTPEDKVKVLDFGLAKRFGSIAGEQSVTLTQDSLTAPGIVAGTLAYMAPEQLRGEAVDARSDIWALGVVLFEMASGARPFQGKTSFELTSSILHEAPPPLSERRRGKMLAALRAVIEKCLEKEPARRYRTAGEVKAALETVERGAVSRVLLVGKRALSRLRWPAVAAALVVILALVAVLDIGKIRSRLVSGLAGPKYRSLAVLPLANLTGDPEQQYFLDGITDTLINGVAQIGSLRVISRTSTIRYRDTDKSLRDIAAELNVDAILEGSAQRAGDNLRVALQLVDADKDQPIWADNYDYSLSDVLRVQSEVVQGIAGKINISLTPEQKKQFSAPRKVNPAVYEAYLRGMYYITLYTDEDIRKGLKILHEAVEIDPAEPLAYAGLAEGYVTIGHSPSPSPETFPRAKAAADRALALDPNMVEAVGALADIALYHDWDWAKAEEYFQQALKLNPNSAMTYYHHAWMLALFNRLDEAVAEHIRARELDPLRPVHTAWLGGLYNLAGRYDEAIVEAKKALELRLLYGPSYYVMVWAYSHKGMHEEAIAAAREGVQSTSKYAGPVLLGIAYALAGKRQEAIEIAESTDVSKAWFTAQLYAALGEKDKALDLLEVCYRDRTSVLPWIRVHGGEYEPLFKEPRFQALVKKMNLPL
ncbi:MAG: protein kinase [Candidatus Aminicenantes bacterium]|nr:protein kinase [Candidatus Aminicenantes bacterium]